jgi:tRNA-splicing ligase RtcB
MKIKKISGYEWEIPKEGKMRVPVRIYASEKLLEGMKKDETLKQAKNVAMLKGIQKKSIVCPDGHMGYGFSIGGVAAFDLEEGIVTPGGVGFDINCGVRLVKTNLVKKKIDKKKLIHQISRDIPKGLGRGGALKISKKDIKEVLEKGSEWALKNNYGTKKDLERTEDYGRLENADSSKVSEKAIKRGLSQLGSLGSGNHFLEIQEIEEIYNNKIAGKWGLEKGKITVMIHCGSRGLGHQVASDYIKKMENKYGTKNIPDRQLVNASIKSDLGQDYLKAMRCAANYAFCNRQIILNFVRKSFKQVLPAKLEMIYDVAHNIAKFEKQQIDGKEKELCIHRKGATRSFGPGREELPEVYKNTGQPVIIPGTMGTSSYLLVGTKKAEELTFGSTAHGAGRVMSRTQAKKKKRGEEVKKELESKGIDIEQGSIKGLAEEAPYAYKDVDEVVKVSDKLGIGNLVAKLKPLAVMKG